MPFSFRQQRAGFTLIEMLVVVSLITLLVSIMLPALSAAKENARRVVCASTVRQLADICAAMANELNQKLPDLHNDSGQWSSVLYSAGPNPHTYDGKARDHMVRSRGLTRQQLYCPSNDDLMWNRDDFWFHTNGRSVWGYSYFAAAPKGHASWTYTDSGTTPVFANTMTDKPRHQIMWSDTNRRIEPYGWFRYDVARASNHFLRDQPTGANNGYLDSHVEWVDYSRMKKRMINGSWSFWF